MSPTLVFKGWLVPRPAASGLPRHRKNTLAPLQDYRISNSGMQQVLQGILMKSESHLSKPKFDFLMIIWSWVPGLSLVQNQPQLIFLSLLTQAWCVAIVGRGLGSPLGTRMFSFPLPALLQKPRSTHLLLKSFLPGDHGHWCVAVTDLESAHVHIWLQLAVVK